jgi:predicted transglutaminase-like cysteine proteinase
MPVVVDRIRHIFRQGLPVIAVAAYVLVLAVALLAAPASGLAASAAEAPSTVDPAAQAAPIRLFGTVEFRSPIKSLPKWERVRDSENRRPTFIPEGLDLDVKNPSVTQRWVALRDRIKDAPLAEKANEVNKFFNQWPYKTDMTIYGVEDYWAVPREFVERSGDCEDYAIAKYYALRELGVPAKFLRVAAVKDSIRNLGHAVLIVYMDDDDARVLDNLTNLVLSHKRLTHYVPQYTVNEDFLWRHVVPRATAPAGK